MIQPFSRSEFPNGGWEYVQPQTGWQAPTPKSSTFDQTVVLIIKHRLQNPAMIVKHRWATDPVGVGNDLENYTRARIGLPQLGDQGPKPRPQQPLPQAVVGAVEGLKRAAYGAAAPLEWLRSGREGEPPEVSEKRASICAGTNPDGSDRCPRNGSPNLTEWFIQKTAELLQKEIERRIDLKLTTPYDEKLGVCKACLCPMKLKVHTPMDIILKHLKPEIKADLDPRCWILSDGQ